MYPEDDEDHLRGMEEKREHELDEGVALAKPEDVIRLEATITKEQFLEVMTERAMERMFGRYRNDSLESNVRERIVEVTERAAAKVVESVMSEAVAEATRKILAEGFQETDSYGRAKGERKTVFSFVLEHLHAKVDQWGNTTNRDGKDRIFYMADAIVQEYLKKEIQPELEALKKRCREAMHVDVVGRIKEALIAGLGLKS